jgi:alcohol dehydrogenase class IV
MSTLHRFSFPTPIYFGNGARNAIAAHLKDAGVKRPLIVTDQGVAGLPICDELQRSLQSGGLATAVFSGIWGNPVKSQVTAGVASHRAHSADGIVGFGGGAALDVAKAIALMVHHPGDLFDYEDDKPGARPFDQSIPYWIGVPTTSGTGSEVGRSSVVSDDETHIKKIIFSPRLLARAVFADPELTKDLPPPVTAATGLDALTHCVEAYLAKGYHPICDGIALEGLRLAARSLVKAVRTPQDLDARGDMMMASMMGAIAFQKGLGITHSCAHALGTVCDLHHGLANGLMIDFALTHNASASEERFRAMAHTVGLGETSAEGFLGWLKSLKADCHIAADLKEAGVSKDKLDALVQVAIADGCHANNPVPCAEEDFRRVFTEALGG